MRSRKKIRSGAGAISFLTVMSLVLAGCSAQDNETQDHAPKAQGRLASAVSAVYVEPAAYVTAQAVSEEGNDGNNLSADAGGSSAVTEDMIHIKESDYRTDWESEDYVTVSADGDSASADGDGVSVSDGLIRIEKEGTYVLTGHYAGTVIVDPGDEDAKVRLVLDACSITSKEGPAILALNADKLTITTADGTDNSVTDSETYADSYTSSDTDYDAAIFSRTDLVMNGTGTLSVQGLYKDAVHSKDDLRITGGSYTVHAVDDAFVGKDRLEITDGTFDVTTSSDHGDAFKSTNTEEEDKGFIYLAGGTYRIHCADEAFQSAAEMLVTGGTYEITANGKGFHADEVLELSGGDVVIDTCYEGLEAPVITINGGTIDVTSTDDGINAAGGGVDSSEEAENEAGSSDGPGNWFWRGMGTPSTGYLYINGGTIHINAAGDGIDSNTNITQTGGDITVDGPTSNMDGPLDYDDTYQMSGGSVFAVGSSGMMQAISDSSSVCCLAVVYSQVQSEGKAITIQDSDGNIVADYVPVKSYQSFVYAGENLEEGKTYTVLRDESVLFQVTLSGTVTMVDDSGQAARAGWGGWGGWHSGGHGGSGGA